jgi:IclR family pca regulon transcriptional regulator
VPITATRGWLGHDSTTLRDAETSVDKLTGEYLPLLLHATADMSHDWSLVDIAPMVVRG